MDNFEYQGKRPEQVVDSYKGAGLCLAAVAVMVIIHFVAQWVQ